MEGVVQCSANVEPLSPVSFLARAASVYGDRVSVVYGSLRYTWTQTHQRCLNLASSLSNFHISYGDVVAAVAPNIPALYELHFAVPMAGAVISALNPRLSPPMLAHILQQLEAKIVFVDYQFIPTVLQALSHLPQINKPLLVLIPDQDQQTSSYPQPTLHGLINYETLVETRDADFDILGPTNEFDPISVSFTSGSTGDPKGAVYSHRATYMNSLAAVDRSDMALTPSPVFLWTVDMFRCNGWCFPWAVAALGGTNVCLRRVSARDIFDALTFHNVTHLCGAPAILSLIADAPLGDQMQLARKVQIFVAGVLPSSRVLDKVRGLGFDVREGYGMTEALGPTIVRPCWPENTPNKVEPSSLHGMHNLLKLQVVVKNPKTMENVPNDGTTIGEVMLRGNTLMSGYLKNPKATKEAFRGGWFRTGDIGVMSPDGYVEMRDRGSDMIISGGEAIGSLEIESVLLRHPKVYQAAVVGRRDGGSGEVLCAFVKVREGCDVVSEKEVVEFCEDHLEHFKVPRKVVFGDLPVNSTGKVQKFVLRNKVNAQDWAK